VRENEKQKALKRVLLISLLLIGSAVFCPNYLTYLDSEYEHWLSSTVCSWLSLWLAARYQSGCMYYYEEYCTVDEIRISLSQLKSSFIDAVVFSKGHRGTPYYPNYNHKSLLDHYGGHLIDYEDIYPRTSYENTFTFLWHCETADKDTYPLGWDEYGYYPMPYCWTHAEDMPEYGNTGAQVYIGWHGGSPQFNSTTNSSPWDFAQVAYLFWYKMCDDYTVTQTLGYIANEVYNEDGFDSTQLYNWLVVYGNMDVGLPYD